MTHKIIDIIWEGRTGFPQHDMLTSTQRVYSPGRHKLYYIKDGARRRRKKEEGKQSRSKLEKAFYKSTAFPGIETAVKFGAKVLDQELAQ